MRSDIVYTHSIDLDAPGIADDEGRNSLDDAERSRADHFRSHRLRRQWTVARAGLRNILAHYCGCSPIQIEFTLGTFGKPELAGEIAKTGVTFNLSHSGNMAVVAVSHNTDLGVDIEFKKFIKDWPGVARRFFSSNENAKLMAMEESCRVDAFFDCWTRKEAIIKATGEGLHAQLDDFDVSLAPGGTTAVLADYSDEQKYIGWRLENIGLGEQFAGALAIPACHEYGHCHRGMWEFRHV
jgi:4'-phosphopantetheinyl transferase